MSWVLQASSGAARRTLRLPAALSLGVHVILVALVAAAARPAGPTGEIYAVTLVAAPSGPRQTGIVNTAPAPEPEKAAAPPKRAEVDPKLTAPVKKTEATKRSTSRATQTPDAKSSRFDPENARKAGGGETGGQGTDVANVRTAGKDFPFPSYLTNISNQIAMRFNPRQRQLLSADVQFIIQKDGTVVGIVVQNGSGSYGFDMEAKGAVEAAARDGAFGPLPDGYSDEALTVIFTFNHKLIR